MTTSPSSSDIYSMEEKMMFPCPKAEKVKIESFFTIATIIALILFSLLAVSCKITQKEFASPETAVQDLVKALQADNEKELLSIFGPEGEDLLYSGDPVADQRTRQKFLQAYEAQNHIEQDGEKFVLIIGKNDWPFPIPIVARGNSWIFDTLSGKQEILDRRIGRNEINTIQVLLAIVDAEREYAMEDRNSDGLLEYARKFNSEPGKKDGLYWTTQGEGETSPLGELIVKARSAGYESQGQEYENEPYHGYIFRILTAQGKNAPGGAYDYIVKGKMIGGFAVLAYPAEYDNSGVMTFIVNHDGIVYQKDLGENTQQLAAGMTLYDPDETWTVAQ